MQTPTTAHTARSAESRELLSGPQFLVRLRQIVDFRERPVLDDPLRQAVDEIAKNPAFSQSRLLLRVLVAIASGTGEFRHAEISALDTTTLALVIAVMDARAAGTRPDADWAAAIETATAASA
jgi:hypothetical protein